MNEKIIDIGYKDIFAQKEYMKSILAGIINRFGDAIDSIAFVWLIYQVTQSAAWSAIIFGTNRIPTIFLQPFAGAIVEGKNKKYILVVMDLIRGVCVGFIATALIMGFLNQWILLIMTLIISSAEAFRKPASNALIPRLLDKKYYEFGLSLNTSACSAVELIGLGAAGFIIAATSISVAIYIDMATFFISAVLVLTINIEEEDSRKEKSPIKNGESDFKGGLIYIKSEPLLRYYAFFGVFLNGILVPFNSLQAPIISQVLNANEVMLSVLGMSLTIGMIIGASIYPHISKKLNDQDIIGIGGYSIGVFYFSFILVGKYIHSKIAPYVIIAIVSFVVGITISLANSACNIKVLKSVEEKYLARVSALMGAVCMAAIPIVSLIISAFVKILSTSVIIILSGVLSIIISFSLCNKKGFSNFIEDKEE